VGVLTQFLSGRKNSPSLRSDHSRFLRSNFRPHGDVCRVHVAAVCYRLRGNQPEFLLVRTRNGHWTFPKGGVGKDATRADAAAREAYEEAGVKGSVERSPFTSYSHCKPGNLRSRRRVVWVHAHLCEVRRLVRPLEPYRNPKWFKAEKAKRQLRKFRSAEFATELITVIDEATERIRGR